MSPAATPLLLSEAVCKFLQCPESPFPCQVVLSYVPDALRWTCR